MKNKLMDHIPLTRKCCEMLMDAQLSDKQLGALIYALLGYQAVGKLPEPMDPVALAFWKVIHADIKRQFGEGIR